MDVETLALAKAYTKATANGLGAVKGAPCTISGTEETDDGTVVTFSWTGNDGTTKTQNITIPKGEKGDDGESPTITAEETDDGTVITITNPDGKTTITTVKGGGSNSTFTDSSVGITLGGFTKGEKISNLSLQEAFYKLLHPYTAPSISLTISPSTTLYEAGTTIDEVQLKATATKASKDLKTMVFYYDSTSLQSYTLGSSSSYTNRYTYSDSITGTNGTSHTFKVTVTDGTSTVNASKTITFIGQSYYGIVDSTVGDPTANQVTGLNKTLKNAKGYSYSGITTDYGKVVYAYPKSLGALSSIKDNVNNYDYTKSFTKTEITINSIDYLVYTQNEASAASNVTITFA